MQDYLAHSPFIDWQTPTIKTLAAELALGQEGVLAVAKACFEFVRDRIRHSGDYQLNPVTISASDTLAQGTGFCYAKSHLLAALLRANGVPAALCYQRLTIVGDLPPTCIHGLNAVYLPAIGWYRLDARGNKAGVDAQFMPPLERLAFNLAHPAEANIPGYFAEPHGNPPINNRS